MTCSSQGMQPHAATLDRLAVLILREYEEMPGLRLTKRQVQRMWTLDPATCEHVLDELQKAHVLRLTRAGRYALEEGDEGETQ
ncbi:MAG TPA: hypothetical protein VH497_17045 [Vicinamibacterales bacterium]